MFFAYYFVKLIKKKDSYLRDEYIIYYFKKWDKFRFMSLYFNQQKINIITLKLQDYL